MGRARQPLRGSSFLRMPDGSLRPVRDIDGNLVMPAEEWEQHRLRLLARLQKTIQDRLDHNPALCHVYGIYPDGTPQKVPLAEWFAGTWEGSTQYRAAIARAMAEDAKEDN